jgi:micrococcal nuclease
MRNLRLLAVPLLFAVAGCTTVPGPAGAVPSTAGPAGSAAVSTGAVTAVAVESYKVTRVVDGDTFTVAVAGRQTKVRVIGLDTPETVSPSKPVGCYGPEASAQAHKLLDGATVKLEFDASQGRTDKYGRTLAHVWVGGSLYSEAMISAGFGHEYTYSKKYTHATKLKAAQAAAKKAGRGLWKAC